MKVVLFCGGQGLRMGLSSPAIPKPMVPIGNRPILWHIMKYYAHFGHKDFVLCLGHNAESIKEFFLTYNEALANDFVLSEGGRRISLLGSDIKDWKVTFADTGTEASVGERLRAVREHVGDDELFLATYGDAVTDAPLPEVIARVEQGPGVGALLCVRPRSYSFHTISVDESGFVNGVRDITQADLWINGGFFVFRNELFDYLDHGEDLVPDTFERLIGEKRLVAHPYEGFWAPMDTLKDKHNLDAMVESGHAPWRVWDKARPEPDARDAAASVVGL